MVKTLVTLSQHLISLNLYLSQTLKINIDCKRVTHKEELWKHTQHVVSECVRSTYRRVYDDCECTVLKLVDNTDHV